jgi:hypothetical protein
VASALNFWNDTTKNDDVFLHHIAQVTGDGTWASFVNVQSKAVEAVHADTSPSKTKI